MEKVDWGKIVERLLLWQWLMAAAAVTSGLGIFLIFGRALPPQLPLFYSLPWGEEQLVQPLWVLVPLTLAVGLAVCTSILVSKIKKDVVLPALVSGAGLTAEVILIVAVLRVVIMVI